MVSVKIVKSEIGQNFEKALKTLQEKVAKVGWLEGIKYTETGLPVAHVAAIHEMGAPSKNIPARPFMKPTIIREENNWKKIAEKMSRRLLKDEIQMTEIMEQIGQSARGEIQKTISNVFSPALRPATIRARMNRWSNDKQLKESTRMRRRKQLKRFVAAGFYKPLIDTGHMRDTIVNTVENE